MKIGVTTVASFLVIVFTASLFAQRVATGKVSGRLTKSGVGVQAMVAFFDENRGPPPRPDRYFRIPDWVTFTDKEGRFEFELPTRRYYIAAIMRKSGLRLGPPGRADTVYLYRDPNSRQDLVTIKKNETRNIGTIGDNAIFKMDKRQAEKVTKIEGTIIGVNKRPVRGVYVVGFVESTASGKPLFVSKKTGRNGKYSLRVHQGGQYYLRARTVLGGGPPAPGSLLGVYGGQGASPITVRTGCTIAGNDIQVLKFQGPGQTATKSGQKE